MAPSKKPIGISAMFAQSSTKSKKEKEETSKSKLQTAKVTFHGYKYINNTNNI